MSKIVMVYFTCGNIDQAELIAEECINVNIAACANIHRNTFSIYKWKGEMCRDSEVSVFLKTTMDKVEQVEDCIKAMHEYETPCILRMPVEAGNKEYLKWVEESLS